MHFLLAFFGLTRALPFTIQSIQENIMNPIATAGFSFDINVHTWHFSGAYSNTRSGETEKTVLNFDDTYLLQTAAHTIRKKYSTTAQFSAPINDYIYIQDQDEFDVSLSKSFDQYLLHGNGWANSDNTNATLWNHLRALASLQHLHDHIQSSSSNVHYDAVVFLRPDALFMNEIPAELVLQQNFASELYVPDFHRSCDRSRPEFNDRFAFGGLKPALSYSNRYNFALDYASKYPMHAERYLYWHLAETAHVDVIELPFRFRRIRANSLVPARDQLLLSPVEQLLSATRGEKPRESVFASVLNALFPKKNRGDSGNVYCHPHPRYIPLCGMAKWQAGQAAKDRYERIVKISQNLLPSTEVPKWFHLLNTKEQGK